ncbi:MAG: hypothetical protein IT210_13265 [Armatimonadetes bacterium]|nr:hypothetical protein [Armatimonadota bacterium]
MREPTEERLYNLLPAIYRVRDAAEGEPLRALLAVIESEMNLLEDDIAGLYENWFIETCEEWVVPYIADLLGVRGLPEADTGAFSRRAFVANTLTYRRRKGTAAVLEQLARDITGWPARAVEFFQLLAATQHVNHIRPDRPATLSLKNASSLELLNGPFERAAHTAEVRSVSGGGRYNIPNIGIFLWRLQSYAVRQSVPRSAGNTPDGRYTFSPFGNDSPLFNLPRTEVTITHLAGEINVPAPLRRRPLYDELEARRQAAADGESPASLYFGSDPVLELFVEDTTGTAPPEAIPPEAILICDLSQWQRPPDNISYPPTQGGADRVFPIRAAVDPVLGRLALPASVSSLPSLLVSFSYGFSGDLGGGPYNRRRSAAQWLDPQARQVTWQMGVTKDRETLDAAPELAATLAEAIQAWESHAASQPQAFGIIALMDSRTYAEDLFIEIPEGCLLAVAAADWPLEDNDDPFQPQIRRPGRIAPEGLHPHIQGNMEVQGTAPADSPDPGALIVDGLLIEGSLSVLPGHLGNLHISHSSLVPGRGGLAVQSNDTGGQRNDGLRLTIEYSVCGPVIAPETLPEIRIADSILDAASESPEPVLAGSPDGILPGPPAVLERVTLLGTVFVRELALASESIFTGPVEAIRRQAGCVRFCYVPDGPSTRTPRRYRCQPDLALGGIEDPAERQRIRARLIPSFTSIIYGDPGYGQLSRTCPEEIRTGAEDGSEMGAFAFLKQPQRLQSLRTALDEYLRFGLEAGTPFET